MKFITNYVMNIQRFTFEAKDVILSLYKDILLIYGGVLRGTPLVTHERM